MASKKKENKLTYLQMPLPEGRKSYRMVKRAWQGLNYKQTIDTGALSMEKNISTAEAPYLVPSQYRDDIVGGYKYPISIFGLDDFLLVIYKVRNAEYKDGNGNTGKRDEIRADYIVFDTDTRESTTHTALVSVDDATTGMADKEYKEYLEEHGEEQRCVVQFNKYLESDDIINGTYTKRLLILPDKKSLRTYIVKTTSNPANWGAKTLASKDLEAIYHYRSNGASNYYQVDEYTDTEGNTARKTQKYEGGNYFLCESMDVTVKKYYCNEPKKDEDGNVIKPKEYPPPESADTNCYYQNTYSCEETNYGKDVYRYCQYDTVDKDGEKDGGTAYGWKVCVPPSFPSIKYATVHASRLFGVGKDSVYVSGFNDYTNWNLDSVDASNESNAWCSKAQSNTKADGDFTGIINFQGHVVCFKRDFMHEIYNTKNPFRIQDIFAEGAIDYRSIQDVDGKLIFVSEDDVKIYTGSNPRIISHELNIDQFTKAVSGTDGRCYYLYCEDGKGKKRLLVYDTIVEQWSEQEINTEVVGFAHNKIGMYTLCGDGGIYKLDSGLYSHSWSFETDLITNQTVNIKHLKKIQMFIEVPEWIKEPDEDDEDNENKTGIENTKAGIDVYLLYDDERYEDLGDTTLKSRKVYGGGGYGRKAIRIKPRNTANYGLKLHVEGYGYVKIYEMELIMENGGDLYV